MMAAEGGGGGIDAVFDYFFFWGGILFGFLDELYSTLLHLPTTVSVDAGVESRTDSQTL